jgi:hypothetical protein
MKFWGIPAIVLSTPDSTNRDYATATDDSGALGLALMSSPGGGLAAGHRIGSRDSVCWWADAWVDREDRFGLLPVSACRRGPARCGFERNLARPRGPEISVASAVSAERSQVLVPAAVMTSKRFESGADARSCRSSALEPGHPSGRVAQSVAQSDV